MSLEVNCWNDGGQKGAGKSIGESNPDRPEILGGS